MAGHVHNQKHFTGKRKKASKLRKRKSSKKQRHLNHGKHINKYG